MPKTYSPKELAELAEHGLTGFAGDRIRFVHGTSSVDGWTRFRQVSNQYGVGEFGRGFYTFMADGADGPQGMFRAQERARDRTEGLSTPVVITLSMSVDEFLLMRKLRLDNTILPDASLRRVVRHEPLIWGIVTGRNGVLWNGVPKQYKFWDVSRLSIDDVHEL